MITLLQNSEKKLMNFHLNLIIIIVFLLEKILVIILNDIKEIIPLGSQICRILFTLFHMLHKSTAIETITCTVL